MELVRRLEDVCQDDVAIAGGKAANLGALLQAGKPVPPGFVLLTFAYHLFVTTNGLQGEIERIAHMVSPRDPSSAEQAARAIRRLFEQGQLPSEVREAVLSAYAELGKPAVAVRSSASAEDLPEASFAGQQETYLNISTPDGLLAAIQRCWCSLWTERALAYRADRRISPASVGMAFVIQQMVPARSASVLFTVNPITGGNDEMVINATWGLGKALVGGQVTPDSIAVEKSTGRVEQSIVGDKAVMTVPTENGTREREVDASRRQEAVLSSGEIAQLTSLGCEIEQFFGTPQDIEWAIADHNIFVLQTRPITTRPIASAVIPRQEDYDVPGDDSWDRPEVPPPQPFDLWTRTNLGENFPFPVSPLSSTAWPALFIQGELPKGDAKAIPPTGVGRRLPSLIAQGVKMARQQSNKPKQSKKRAPKLTTEQLFALIDQWVSDFQEQELSQLDDRALPTGCATRLQQASREVETHFRWRTSHLCHTERVDRP